MYLLKRFVLVLFYVVCFSDSAFAQSPNFKENVGFTSALSKANAGTITFASKDIALAEYTENHFITSYELTNKSQLFMTAFLEKPLSKYLPGLSPGKSPESLDSIGSYYFSFYVDDSLIYVCGLPPDNVERKKKLLKPLSESPLSPVPGNALGVNQFGTFSLEAAGSRP
jgi:hypothetical protein